MCIRDSGDTMSDISKIKSSQLECNSNTILYTFSNCFSPYLSADLRLMASSFNATVNQLEDELMALILDGQIQARIDSHNKVSHMNYL